jgi:Holliday junction resolvasome RuvABC endonuclease subunit
VKYSIGIDPGLRETGVVLCHELPPSGGKVVPTYEVVEWVTFSCPSGSDEDLTRVVSLASSVVHAVLDFIQRYEIEELDIGIELPVYKHNAATYTKQIRLLEEIESGIFFTVTGEVEQLFLTEVYPTTSKSLLTGSAKADKNAMISAYVQYNGEIGTNNQHTRETVADAYAHSLSTWISNSKVQRLNLTDLKAAIVKETGRDVPCPTSEKTD